MEDGCHRWKANVGGRGAYMKCGRILENDGGCVRFCA